MNAGADTGNSNASGKSLLVSAIPQLRYESSPVNDDKVRQKAKKDSWSSGTELELELEAADGHLYSCTKHMQGTSFKYSMTRDGKQSKVRPPEFYREKLAQIFPWSEAEFYSHIYLDSRRPAALQLGSPTQRLEFFTQMFKLDHIDAQRKLIKQQLNQLADNKLVLQEVEARSKQVDAELDGLDDTDGIEELRVKCGQISAKRNKLYGLMTQLKAVAPIMDDYSCARKYAGSSCAEMQEWLEKAKRRRSKAKAELEAAAEWAAYRKAKARYDKVAKTAQAECAELHASSWVADVGLTDVKALRRRHLEYVGALSELRRTVGEGKKRLSALAEQLDAVAHEFAAIKAQVKAEHVPHKLLKSDAHALGEHVSKLESELGEHRQAVRAAKEAYTLFESTIEQDCPCPSCTQLIDSKTQKLLAKQLKRGWEQADDAYSNFKAETEAATLALNYVKLKARGSELQAQADQLEDELAAQVPELKSLSARGEAAEHLMDKLSSMPDKPEAPDSKEPDGDPQSRYDQLCDAISCVTTVVQHADTCTAVLEQGDDCEVMLEECEAKLSKLDTSSHKDMQLLAQMETNVKVKARLLQEKADIQARLDKLAPDEDAELWGILYECMGNKGLKTLLVQKLAKHLEFSMNKHSRLLYREPIRFEFIVEGTNFHILVHRKNSKRAPADVRTLSGAESRCFNFLLALAIIQLQPASTRSNLMILDEPEVGMDDHMKEKFFTEFLPRLCGVVESIIIVTPLPHESLKWGRKILVTKQGHSSTIEETFA